MILFILMVNTDLLDIVAQDILSDVLKRNKDNPYEVGDNPVLLMNSPNGEAVYIRKKLIEGRCKRDVYVEEDLAMAVFEQGKPLDVQMIDYSEAGYFVMNVRALCSQPHLQERL
jgi:hypothetical protein